MKVSLECWKDVLDELRVIAAGNKTPWLVYEPHTHIRSIERDTVPMWAHIPALALCEKKRDHPFYHDQFWVIPTNVAATAMEMLAENRAFRSLHCDDYTLDLSGVIHQDINNNKLGAGRINMAGEAYTDQHMQVLQAQLVHIGFDEKTCADVMNRVHGAETKFSVYSQGKPAWMELNNSYAANLRFVRMSDIGLYYFESYRAVFSTPARNWAEEVKVDNLNLSRMNFNTTPSLQSTLSKLRDTDQRYALSQAQEKSNKIPGRKRGFKK